MRSHLTPFCTLLLSLACVMDNHAQKVTEVAQPLTEEAQDGFVDDVKVDPDGKIHVIYRSKLEKKSDVLRYEDYAFDGGLGYLGITGSAENKEMKEDKSVKMMGSYVGGGPKCTSFDVLSMKVRIVTYTRNYSQTVGVKSGLVPGKQMRRTEANKVHEGEKMTAVAPGMSSVNLANDATS